jgi:putative transposase
MTHLSMPMSELNNRMRQKRGQVRGMRRFKSAFQEQRFVSAHAAVYNLLNLGRHQVRAEHYRELRIVAFSEWSRAVA